MRDGVIVNAAQEETFHPQESTTPGFPPPCHRVLPPPDAGAHTTPASIAWSFYDKPFLKFERLLETYLAFAPRGFRSFRMAMPLWIERKAVPEGHAAEGTPRDSTRRSAMSQQLLFTEHHLSHAASAFFPSPFKEAAIITVDGVGEWATTSVGVRRGRARVELLLGAPLPPTPRPALQRLHLLHRLQGQLRRVQAHGPRPLRRAPSTPTLIKDKLVEIREDGSFHPGHVLLRLPRRPADDQRPLRRPSSAAPRASPRGVPIGKREMEPRPLHPGRDGRRSWGEGGSEAARRPDGEAARASAWRAAWRSTASPTASSSAAALFDDIWVQPAAGDAGGALGAALYAWYQVMGRDLPRKARRHARLRMRGGFLGPGFTRRPKSSAFLRTLFFPSTTPLRGDARRRAQPLPRQAAQRRRRSSASSRAGWSSAPAPSAAAPSSPTQRKRQDAVLHSTSPPSSGRASAPSPPSC